MYRRDPECWVWRPRQVTQTSGRFESIVIENREEEEEEESPEGCCYNTGCGDEAQRAPHGPSAPFSLQPITVSDADDATADISTLSIGGCWPPDGPGMETQRCVCACGQREPVAVGPCWPEPPYLYYGVRRSVVVGVQVVEEVAVEDTIEIITEDVYSDDLDDQLFPT